MHFLSFVGDQLSAQAFLEALGRINPTDLAAIIGQTIQNPATTPAPPTTKSNEFMIENSESIPVKHGFEIGASVPLGSKIHLVEQQRRELEMRRLREQQKQREMREKRLRELRRLEEQQRRQLEIIRQQREQLLQYKGKGDLDSII